MTEAVLIDEIESVGKRCMIPSNVAMRSKIERKQNHLKEITLEVYFMQLHLQCSTILLKDASLHVRCYPSV